MKTRTNFTHRVDMWDDAGQNIIEHLASIEDFEVAEAAYRAAVNPGPGRPLPCVPMPACSTIADAMKDKRRTYLPRIVGDAS
jgi:hypothetical protein